MHRNIGYDPVHAFTPVALLITAPLILTVHSSLPVNTMGELVAYARTNPGKVVAGSQGFGTGPHLLIELLKLETGVNIVHVPYRGSAPATALLAAGEIQMFFDPTPTILPPIQSGKARPLAVATSRASQELAGPADHGGGGVSEIQSRSGSAWWRRAAPRPLSLASSTRAFRESLASPETRERLAHLSADITIGTPAEFGKCSPTSSRCGPAWRRPPTSR